MGGLPRPFYKRMLAMRAEVEALTEKLTRLRRATQIAGATSETGPHAEFVAMLKSLATLIDDDRYIVRAKIAAELRRIIEVAECDGAEMVIRLKPSRYYQIEFNIQRSTVDSMMLRNLAAAPGAEISTGYYPLPGDAALPSRGDWGGCRVELSPNFGDGPKDQAAA
jgi:hypothetical protein